MALKPFLPEGLYHGDARTPKDVLARYGDIVFWSPEAARKVVSKQYRNTFFIDLLASPVMANDIKVMVWLIFIWVFPAHLVVEKFVHLADILLVVLGFPLQDGARATVPGQNVENYFRLKGRDNHKIVECRHNASPLRTCQPLLSQGEGGQGGSGL